MIVNLDSLKTGYPGISSENLENCLIDTWFIEDKLGICEFNFSYAKSRSPSDTNIIEVIKAIKSSSASYDHFEIDELFLGYISPSQNIFDYVHKLTNPSIVYGTGETLIFNRSKTWDDLDLLLSGYKSREFCFLRFMINCDLTILDCSKKSLRKHIINQAMEIMIGHEGNKLESNFFLSIGLSFWSLLREDNREDIMMIYLFSCGLLKCGTKRDRDTIAMLLNIGELNQIVEQVKRIGTIEVTQEEFEFYEFCILVLPDNDKLYLRNNQELARKNSSVFLDFINRLEQSFEKKAHSRFPEIYSS